MATRTTVQRGGAVRDLADLVRRPAAPENVALVFQGRVTTYGDLDRRASRVANGLLTLTTSPEARVAVLDKNSDCYFELLFGAVKARHVPVGINWRLAPPEVAHVVHDAEAEVLFVGEAFFPVVDRILPELPTVKQVIALSGHHDGWEDYAAWSDRQDDADSRLPIARDDVALQFYTSGTTGRPKGAQLTHDNLLTMLPTALGECCRYTAADVLLACLPQFHLAGVIWSLVSLFAGARTVIAREVVPAELLRLIAAERVTLAVFVPAVLLFLLQTPGCESTDFSSLRRIVYGASPIPLDLLRRALATFRCEFEQVYGLTETTAPITYLPPEDHDPAGTPRMASCGRPLSTAELKVVDARGADLPPGAVGEIVCRSRQVMTGYWHLPEATAEAIRDGWLYTGDAGYFDADGYLYIYDRIKDLIVSGGENVYPAEVESALFAHPAVADVGVIGVPDERWGEAVKAIVVLQPGAQVTAAELLAFARERIAGYKVPKSIDFAAALPRNPSGKILKRELRAPYWAGQERQVH